MNIAVKVAGAFGLLGMLVAAVLITKFYFIDEWYEPEWRRHERNYERCAEREKQWNEGWDGIG